MFSGDPEWDSTYKNRFTNAYNAWIYGPEKDNGGYLLTNGGTTWTGRWDDDLPSTRAAQAACVPNNIEFNALQKGKFNTGTWDFQSTATHEWGHAFGLGHVSQGDVPSGAQAGGGYPTMGVCVADTTRRSLSPDDQAAVIAQSQGVTNGDTLTANSGFEESSHKAYWRTQNVSSFSTTTSGGGVDGSPWYATIVGYNTNSALYQDTWITSEYEFNARGRANYRKAFSTDSGSIKLTTKVRPYNHSGNACGNLANSNDAGPWHTSLGGWLYDNEYCTVSSSWNFCTNNVYLTYSGNEHRVMLARVVVYNRMLASNGTTANVKLDRVRVMGKSY